MLLAVALLLSTLILRLDGRFLEISKQPPGTVAIVPNDDDGESVLFGPLLDDLQELDREKASEMISVKLLNQYHAKTFDVEDQLNGNNVILDDGRPLSTGLDYGAVNDLQAHGNHHETPFIHPSPIDADVIDMKENVIEQDFAPTETIVDKRLLKGWIQSANSVAPSSENNLPTGSTAVVTSRKNKANSMPDTTATTTTTMTTTSTTTKTTTVRKVQRKIRRLQSVSSSSSTHRPSSSTQQTSSSRVVTPTTTTTTSAKPHIPKIDITKLNLDHLENDLLPFPTLIPPQALALSPVSSSARLLPRSIKPDEVIPTCGCQHKKRSLAKDLYSSEEMLDPVDDYYDDYDYNEVQKMISPRSLANRPMLFPAMSRLLAAGSGEMPESSIERAEKVHGTLERLMGIVTIFSHVDEFIQRKTKQSIRRLARLYESDEVH